MTQHDRIGKILRAVGEVNLKGSQSTKQFNNIVNQVRRQLSSAQQSPKGSKKAEGKDEGK